MGATLDALLRLQTIENQLRNLNEKILSKRRSVEVCRKRVSKLEQQIAETHQSIKQAQAGADRFELDRKAKEEHIQKLKEALNRTKSNKEYAALLTQLNMDKADSLKIEDQVLAVMGRVDEERKKEREFKARLEKEHAQVAELTRVAAANEAGLAAEVKDLENQRAEAAALVPLGVLQIFEKTCEKHDGEAMALLHKTHPKRAEFVCNGCNMAIPLEIVNALQSGDKVYQCQTCSRILFLESSGIAV
ncbi:MAG TPA: C4-type zinc ribbon domain-containing protein [Phycisphaerae bacterium]|nr:C4-type zinc ribbon domain-containing protein [Phycisphaerae bacterium]HRY67529.1 C4-type zinc ribbon domain-containing protein [Phycisphaerae bacterium]HSA24916.1 C4-type zinc ribbon domain-containing protein [Phycisphaerae bacterium]